MVMNCVHLANIFVPAALAPFRWHTLNMVNIIPQPAISAPKQYAYIHLVVSYNTPNTHTHTYKTTFPATTLYSSLFRSLLNSMNG